MDEMNVNVETGTTMGTEMIDAVVESAPATIDAANPIVTRERVEGFVAGVAVCGAGYGAAKLYKRWFGSKK